MQIVRTGMLLAHMREGIGKSGRRMDIKHRIREVNLRQHGREHCSPYTGNLPDLEAAEEVAGIGAGSSAHLARLRCRS